MSAIKQIALTEVTHRLIAIIELNQGDHTGEYFQVTIDPDHVSPSGRLMRLGDYPGDEIAGWQPVESIAIVEILGYWPLDKKETPSLRWGHAGTVAESFR